jgi:hypothetical protein
MKDRNKARGWLRFALPGLLALGMAAAVGLLLDVSLPTPASANSELHPGGRLFFPAWDIRNGRATFFIITRLSLPTTLDVPNYGKVESNCRPGHTTAFPYSTTATEGGNHEVDAVHLQFYGKNCEADSEVLEMSCADVDLLFLNAANKSKHISKPDNQGSLDVHFTLNQSPEDITSRVFENSLMGHGVIVDGIQGWAAIYPAASAKATFCSFCDVDNGTEVGYEPFPTELFIPFAFADDSQGGLVNELYLWAPSFFPGGEMDTFFIEWRWYDGRERQFRNDTSGHSIIDLLKTIDKDGFRLSTFRCGHTSEDTVAENDGAPQGQDAGKAADDCDGISFEDNSGHPSDNDQTVNQGFSSTPIGWWDIRKTQDGAGNFLNTSVKQVRGLVGVLLTTVSVYSGFNNEDGSPINLGNGDAIRLWHKDPCEVAPLGDVGPPHLRDRGFVGAPSWLVGFNIFSKHDQLRMCNGQPPEGNVADDFRELTRGDFGQEND